MQKQFFLPILQFRLINRLHKSISVHNFVHSFRSFTSNSTTISKHMEVYPIPALADNYMYLLVCKRTKKAAAIDPVQSDKVLELAKKFGVTLHTILTTHHHWDHAGGNTELVSKLTKQYPDAKIDVFGGDERVPGITEHIKNNHIIEVGSLKVQAFPTPCHTTGHLCFYVDEGSNQRAVFTGDTLFIAGCGKMFEGSPEQMLAALTKLSKLPPETAVYCGHEYTYNNLRFAQRVEPKNSDIIKKLAWAKRQMENDKWTIPSTIEEELRTNPFMRVNVPEVQEHIGDDNLVRVMGRLRAEKDMFK